MKDKEKQIEEIAKVMCSTCLSVEQPCYMKNQPCSLTKKQAQALYEQGYRKLPEDSVVFSREEWEAKLDEQYEKGQLDTRNDFDGK